MSNNQMKSKKKKNRVVKRRKKIITKQKQAKIDKKRTKYMGYLLLTIFLLLFLAISIQVLKIELTHQFRQTDVNAYVNALYSKETEQIASRGIITDQSGIPLATNIETYDMYAHLDPEYTDLSGKPDYVDDPDQTAEALLDVLGLENNQEATDLFYEQLNQQDLSQVEFGQYGKNLSLTKKNEIDALNLPGIAFTSSQTRYYPYGDFASYVLGYATTDENGEIIGQMGLELFLDGYLRGENGGGSIEVDSNGIPLSSKQTSIISKTDGVDVALTIDSQIQTYVQTYMKEYYEDQDFDMAFTLVMDANTGGILAANVLPSFDPNVRDIENFVNPFTDYCFEPGSTIKSFAVASAMEEGVWDPTNTEETGIRSEPEWGEDNDGDPYYIADSIYNEHNKMTWGTITWEQGFYFSSNTVMTHVLDAITNPVWDDYMKNKYLFGTPVSSSYMQTAACSFDPEYPLEYANTSFGQGMSVNAMQMLRAYSIFVNDGKMLQPHIVKSMTDSETNEVIYEEEEDQTLQQVQVISEKSANDVLDLMNGVVYYQEPGKSAYYSGTGYAYQDGDVEIAAKTGTAEVANDGVYSMDNGVVSSAMIAAPYENPEILVYSVVVNPITGSANDYAAPADTHIVDSTIEYLNQSNENFNIDLEYSNYYQLKNYLGEDIESTSDALSADGIDVYTIGEGEIIAQYPSNEQQISNDETVILMASNDYNPQEMVGLNYNQAYGVCQVLNYNCQFSGLGEVSEVTKDDDLYIIKMQAPDNIQAIQEDPNAAK